MGTTECRRALVGRVGRKMLDTIWSWLSSWARKSWNLSCEPLWHRPGFSISVPMRRVHQREHQQKKVIASGKNPQQKERRLPHPQWQPGRHSREREASREWRAEVQRHGTGGPHSRTCSRRPAWLRRRDERAVVMAES